MPEQSNDPHSSGPGTPAAPGPLDGVLVADFSRLLAGPYCTMMLADFGAEVIKVESAAGDDTRTWTPPVREGVSTYYLAINRNKRSIVLDFNNPGDLAAARELAARADVVVENFKVGGLARFGLDYDTVRQGHQDVVYCSISGFGPGAGAAIPGYDLVVQAMSGLMSLTGEADGRPYRAGTSVFDVMTGMHASLGILAALNHRARTGTGQRVEVNLLSSALSALANQTSAFVAGGVVPSRMGNAHPSLFPYEPLPTADRELVIIAGNDGQFFKLCHALGLPELPGDERFARNQDRTRNREQLRPLLVERLRTRKAQEWFDILTDAGVPCGPINTVEEGVALAQDLGLTPVVRAGQGRSAVPVVRNPVTLSATPPRHVLAPPALDQDAQAVRAWLAGPRGPFGPTRSTGPSPSAPSPGKPSPQGDLPARSHRPKDDRASL